MIVVNIRANNNVPNWEAIHKNVFKRIYIINTDIITGNLVIIAGEEIEVSISPEGKVKYGTTEAEF